MMNKSDSIECNSIEATDKTDLSEQTKFWLDEISKLNIVLSERLTKENHAVKIK